MDFMTAKKISNAEEEPLQNLYNVTSTLLNQLLENKKLLHEVEFNQKRVEQQLNVLLNTMISQN